MIDKMAEIAYTINVEIKKAVTLRGFFISTLLTSYRPFCQSNIFGARVPAITLYAGNPHVSLFLISTIRKSSVVAGIFSFLPNRQGSLSVSPRKLPLTKADPPGGGQRWLQVIYFLFPRGRKSAPPPKHFFDSLRSIPFWTFRVQASPKSQITALNSAPLAAAGWMSPRIITRALIVVTGF